MELRLPEEKLQRVRTTVLSGLAAKREEEENWSRWWACTPWAKVCKMDHCADDISSRSGLLCKIKC